MSYIIQQQKAIYNARCEKPIKFDIRSATVALGLDMYLSNRIQMEKSWQKQRATFDIGLSKAAQTLNKFRPSLLQESIEIRKQSM